MPESSVNGQITDSVSQTITAVIGSSPSETKSMLDTLMAETVGMAMYNAVTNQHNAQMVSNASMTAACARMLKTPYAMPPLTAVVVPMIDTVTPQPVPLIPAVASVDVTGTGFDASIAVEIVRDGVVYAALKGASQLQNISAVGFSFSNAIFTAPGLYSVFVKNAAGAASEMVPLQVQALPPVVSAVATCAGGLTVSGNYFQPNLTAAIANQSGVAISGFQVGNTTSSAFTVLFGTAPAAGIYSIRVTNPDGSETAPFLFTVPAA